MLETQDLIDFSINRWYENFKHISLETIILPIPTNIIAAFKNASTDIELRNLCSAEWLKQIKNAIQSLKDGKAFVKNNWHAPLDSKFLAFGNSLVVSNIQDMFLYLTASELILNDFTSNKFEDYSIVLKQWIDIHPASEFRSIVINDILWGITPRDWPTFYAHFSEDAQSIIENILTFFKSNIRGNFCRKTFVFDVILRYSESIIVVDFGPLNSQTNLYAFNWNEVHNIIKKEPSREVSPVFRFLEKDIGILSKLDALTIVTDST